MMSSSPTKAGVSATFAQKRAALAARLQNAVRQPRECPLSFAQQRLWFLDQLEPNTALYNIGALACVDGSIQSDKLKKALDALAERHETLRTRFTCPDETPIQVIDPSRGVELKIIDLQELPEAARESNAREVIQAELNHPFDLAAEHPIRVFLVHLSPRAHRLLVILHHIIADEWSLKVFFSELAALYNGFVTGEAPGLPKLSIQYGDFGNWQRQWLQGQPLRQQLEYWKTQLDGYPPTTELPPDNPRGVTPTFRGKTIARRLGRTLTDSLRDLARKNEATLFMVLLAAFKTLVHRYTQQDDLIICSPVAGRNRVETENLIGFFVNTLTLRSNLAGNPQFSEFLARVRQVTLGALAHQDLPFERIVEELHPERSLTHLPFTKLMFSFQAGGPEQIELAGASLRFLEVEPELAKFDITLVVRESSQGLVATVEYNRDLFQDGTIDRLLGHFEVLLQGIVSDPASRLSELPLLTATEQRQTLVEWNETSTIYPRDRCVHELFEEQAARTPDATAALWGHVRMSYGELNSRANQLARFLKQFDIKPDVPVGLCVARSPEMLVGMLGILKAGGTYVPLDAGYPKERLAFMLEDTGAPVILTQQRLLSRVPRDRAKIVCLDADWELIGRELRDNTASLANARNLAYVMYTSGSTGRPKGVAVPHRGVSRLVLNTNFIRLDPSDRIAQVSNISFDAATFEIWGALLNGAQLVGITRDVALSPKDFATELREQGITAMFLTTALFNQLASEAPGAFETLRTVIAGGEALDPKWVRSVLNNRPPQRLVNGYGPTENTTFTCCQEIDDLPQQVSNVPIGKPISNTTVYILDRNLNPVPIGVPGELYTGGDGLARGYWRRPELTAEKFVPNPFDCDNSSYLYRTGDLARFLSDGTIEFLGRIDDQVKIRGFRIELGEIETLLSTHPNVRECVVKVCGTSSAEKRLVAYVAPAAEPAPNASELRSFLLQQLPDYMIPSAFVGMATLPLTPNGKVDRKALPAPDQTRPTLDRQYVAPRDSTEQQLVSIWESVLSVRPIGIQDKFFDLGGHSMLAVRVIAQIEKAFGRKLRLATLFQTPTIERLASVLREEIKETAVAAGTSLVEIQSAGSRPPLFLVHGAGGGMFWGYVNLARCLGNDQPVFGFKSRGLDGHKELDTIQEMAAQYVADLRKVQPRGPYHLGGYCFGGNVAYEMACQLTAQGEQVALLALLNCAPPHSSYTRIPWTPRWWLRFARNLVYWANYFRHWSPAQRREFFRWKVQLFKKRLARRASSSKGSPIKVEPGDLVDLSSYTEDQKRIWETHIRALVNFRPRPYAGKVHLFRSPGHPLWCSFDEYYGWGELARGGVKLITVAGAHEKILEDPWVKALSERLAAELQEALNGELTAPTSNGGPERNTGSAISEQARTPSPAVDLNEIKAQELGYWRTQLADIPELLELPADHARSPQNLGPRGRHAITFDCDLCQKMKSMAAARGCDTDDLIIAAMAGVLERYTGSALLALGLKVPSAASPGLPDSVGSLKLVALRCDLTGSPSFIELVRRIRQTRMDAARHSTVPFAEVVGALRPNPSPSYTPLFQVFLALERAANPLAGPDANLCRNGTSDPQISKCDIVLHLAEGDQGFAVELEYNAALFESARVARLAEHLRTWFRSALQQPDLPISKLSLLSPRELQTLLVDWTATHRDYPRDKTLADLVQEQAERTPAAEALVCGETRLTYRQLCRQAKSLAARLQKSGVQPESLVGICLERSVEMVVAILGVLFAGGAYVPLDPKYPKDRLGFTLEDAKVKVLITQTKLLELLPPVQALVMPVDGPEDLFTNAQAERLEHGAKPANLAYVIYTSGSTGKPKGVALEHRNAVEMVSWAKETFSPEELSGVLASTSICFDLSVFELFVPLCWGGKVILVENALSLGGLAAAGEVRLINTVPSAMRELLRLRAVPRTVKVVNLAGEPLSSELVDQIYRETGVARVFDLYGPTETTTYSTGGVRKPGQPATIGRPLANEQVYLFDSAFRLVPIGNPGELFIGGPGVTRGYLNRPDLTAERFVPHPFHTGERLYRTGDLARWREDGTLEYLGRIDHQVKIRGFRIELGEIEAVLKAHPGIASSVVVAREDEPGDKRLVAYLVLQSGAHVSPEDLRQEIRTHLPDFMMPSDFVFLETLPLTPNGKIDRKALPAPAPRAEPPRADLISPRNAIEKQLTDIWSEVLRLKQISIDDNFFDLGGHSLLAVRVLSAIRDSFGVELPFTALFSAPTVAALSELVSRAAKSGQAPIESIVSLSRSEPLPVSYVQERLWFLDQLEPGSPAYNVPAALRLKGSLDRLALARAFNQVVARHEALRTTLHSRQGALVQVVAPRLSIEIPCIEVELEPRATQQARAVDLLTEAARRPFDLSAGPLLRATLFRLADTEHLLLVALHHSISDGWSLALFFQDLAAYYNAAVAGGPAPELPPLPAQYVEFASWQRRRMSGASLDVELAHWKTLLSGAPSEIALPLDKPRPAQPTGRAKTRSSHLADASVRQLTEFACQEGCTPFMVFLTSLMMTLSRWSGQKDLVIGTVVAGRTRREFENVIGCFMNFLPLRARLEGAQTLRENLALVRSAVLDGQIHQDCPFEKMVEALNPPRRRDQNPLYNVMLLLQNFPANLFEARELQAATIPISLGAALLDLRFEIEQAQDGLSLSCEYKTDLFNEETVEKLLAEWLKVLESLVSASQTRLLELLQAEVTDTPAAVSQASEPASEKVVVAGTFTAEPLAEPLRYWLRRLELPADIEFAPYNQIFQQLLDPHSAVGANSRGLNVILVRCEDWLPLESSGELRSHPGQALERSAAEFLASVKTAGARNTAPMLVCLCPASPGKLAVPEIAAAVEGVRKRLEHDLAGISGVYVLSADEIFNWYPVAEYHDQAAEQLGHVPYTAVFFTALATALVRKYHALKRPAYKVIALDCDNTLWSGVCGEEGPQGVQLDAARRALQEFMRRQRDNGMLLCLCSKNNEQDVQAVFSQRAEFPLQAKDFAACRLNWLAKSENLKSLASELGLGLDSFIFVDDNPVECADVQANCPEVLTLQLPEDPAQLPQFLNHCWVFDRLRVTAEDRQRAELYQKNRMREQLRAEAPTLEAFLASLELSVHIESIAPEHWARVSQLTQRTNQFNLTTRRMSEQDLAAYLESGRGLIVRVSDRFGDYGLVGAVLYRLESDALDVETLLLSCRVLGRGVEHRMVAHLGGIARDHNLRWVNLKFIPSAKNKPAFDFLQQNCAAHQQPFNGGSVFRLPVDSAAGLAFHPATDNGPGRAAAPVATPEKPALVSAARFDLCRAIALETCDMARIHQQVRGAASVRSCDHAKYKAPRTDLERFLCNLWQELLHVEPVGVADNFFEMGGHSLLAVRVFADIEKRVGRKIPLVTLFQAPTIEQLARLLEEGAGAGSLLVPIQPHGNKPPLFLVHGAGGDVLWGYANLAPYLPADQPIYGIRSHGQQGSPARLSLEEMARSYLEVVRTRQPQGPYYLGGYCFGGNVAYEMARQLRLQGQSVELVVLLDTAPANAGYERVTWWRTGFGSRFMRNFRYWLRDFRALEAEDRRRFIGRKARALGRRLQQRLGLGAAEEGFNVEEVIDPRHFPEHELKLWQVHLEALVAHVERPYRGRVALLRTHGQPLFCSLEDDFCWRRLIDGPFSVHYLPGAHENIFMEPHVRALAAELTCLLREANAGQATPPAAVVPPVRTAEVITRL